jgi:hypothetical protein
MVIEEMTYLLGLAILVLLPVSKLLLQFLDNTGNIALLHGRVDVDAAEVLNGANVKLELASDGRSSSVALAALLLLAASSSHKVLVVVLLALDEGTLELLTLDLAEISSSELAGASSLRLGDG